MDALIGALLLVAQAASSSSLPPPRLDSGCSVERAMHERRSVRAFGSDPLTLSESGQLLWAAQGITGAEGQRAAPSAGALYPLEVYLVVGRVNGLKPGLYHYTPATHALTLVRAGDERAPLAAAAFGQEWVSESPAVLVFAAVERRTSRKYGDRAPRYVAIEVGHAAQNVFLQAVCLGLGAGVVGAFDDLAVGHLLSLPEGESAVYLMPVGRPR
jgi:SagB-type dehydrogenase family enzyme